MFNICPLFLRPYQMEEIYNAVKIITVFFNFLSLFEISKNMNFKRFISPTQQCVNKLHKNLFGRAILVHWYTICILVSGISQLSHKSSLDLLICFSLCLLGKISWRYLKRISLELTGIYLKCRFFHIYGYWEF